MNNYGERLRTLRGNEPLEAVGDAVGITRTALCAYENENRVPKDSIKVKLAEYYNTTVQAIFFKNEESNMIINVEEVR